MRARHRIALPFASAITAVLLLVPVSPAAAKTTVSVKGDVATLTVPIDCAGCKGAKAPDGSDLAKYWEKTAEKAWNDAFAMHPYCSQYKFELDVKIKAKRADFKGKDGDHLIQVSTGNPNGRLVPPPGFEGHGSGAYDQDFDGAWDEALPDNGVEHEVGHLLGLGDDYVVVSTHPRKTTPKPGRANTMMADGGPIDQTLINDIGKQLEKLGLIDKCKSKTFQGTVQGHREYAGQTVTSNGTATLTVDEHKRITGTVQANGVCACGAGTIDDGATWTVSGSAHGDELNITAVQIAEGGYFDELIPRVPFTFRVGRGSAVSATFQGGQTVLGDATLTFDLKCTNCNEAVG